MIRALVLSEPGIESIKRITLGLLEELDGYETEVIIMGNPEEDAVNLIRGRNVKRIILLKGNTAQSNNQKTYIDALQDFVKNNHFDIVFSGSTFSGQDVLSRLSAIFRTSLASAVKNFFVENERLFCSKEIYGGKCLVDIELLSRKPWFMTTRPSALKLSNRADHNNCEIIDINVPNCGTQSQLIEIEECASRRPSLENADIVVAGGRGVGNKTKWKALEELADALGAALGASGGAIGNDFAPKEYLVGQTGAQISPLLYIACGISGATQHLAGIRNAKRILAINSDANAPLMQIADYAIVGDLRCIVPALTKHLINKK